jgi:hypothetical protein
MRSAAAARDASSAAAPAEPEWAWSVDVAGYDRRPGLRPLELAASAALVKELVRRLPWPNRVPTVLERLVQPVEDALARAGGVGRLRTAVLHVMAREMHRRSRVFWGWTHEEWVETLGETERDCPRRHHGMPEKRQHLIAVAYLLGEFTDWSAVGEINKLGLARKIFGPERVDATVGRVLDAARGLGYGSKVQDRLQVALCEALLANHSPRLGSQPGALRGPPPRAEPLGSAWLVCAGPGPLRPGTLAARPTAGPQSTGGTARRRARRDRERVDRVV